MNFGFSVWSFRFFFTRDLSFGTKFLRCFAPNFFFSHINPEGTESSGTKFFPGRIFTKGNFLGQNFAGKQAEHPRISENEKKKIGSKYYDGHIHIHIHGIFLPGMFCPPGPPSRARRIKLQNGTFISLREPNRGGPPDPRLNNYFDLT